MPAMWAADRGRMMSYAGRNGPSLAEIRGGRAGTPSAPPEALIDCTLCAAIFTSVAPVFA